MVQYNARLQQIPDPHVVNEIHHILHVGSVPGSSSQRGELLKVAAFKFAPIISVNIERSFLIAVTDDGD